MVNQASRTPVIVAPVDFTAQSLVAFDQACNLGKVLNAEIVVLYVIEDVNPMIKLFYKGLDDMQEAVESNLKNLVNEQKKKIDLSYTTIVEKGRVYNKVIEVASRVEADFIVMGTKTNTDSKYIGMNALRVVKTAPCKVITINGKSHKSGCDRIVLPLDLAKDTADKVNLAIKMAKLFKAEIYVISVLSTNKEGIILRLTKQIETVQKSIQDSGINCITEIIKTDKEKTTAQTVRDYAKSIEADLIIIMTQKEKGLKELFLGSSAHQIINHSDIPVMSVLPFYKMKDHPGA